MANRKMGFACLCEIVWLVSVEIDHVLQATLVKRDSFC